MGAAERGARVLRSVTAMTDALLATIAADHGTPVYVYDLGAVRDAVTRLRRALPGASLRYAVKANANADVLRTMAGAGVGGEAITLGELERALRAGMPPAELVLGGPRQDRELIERAARAGIGLCSLDGPGQWSSWEAVLTDAPGCATRFVVRVNPELDPRTHEHLATGAATSKFGVDVGRARELAARVAGAGRLAGFHVHAGSMIRDAGVYDQIFERLEGLFAAFPACDTLDIGGGFAVPGFPLDAFAARVRAFAARHELAVVLEPGRYLVADAGTLVTRVLHVKTGALEHVIADAGMADLLRPALYGAEHPIRVLRAADGSSSDARRVDVDGPLCENADRLGRERSLPPLAPGDLLAVGQAGAYGFAMASNYASSLRPAEVVVESDGATPRLSRRRERPEDLWRLEDEAR